LGVFACPTFLQLDLGFNLTIMARAMSVAPVRPEMQQSTISWDSKSDDEADDDFVTFLFRIFRSKLRHSRKQSNGVRKSLVPKSLAAKATTAGRFW